MNPHEERSRTTIEKLFIHLQSDDLNSFSEAFSPIRGRIVRLAQQRLQRDDVEDVVQQTLSTFWEKRNSVFCPEHLLPFLFQILRNKIGDTYRQKQRRKKTQRAIAEHFDSQQGRHCLGPERLLEGKEFEKVLLDAIELCAAENSLWGQVLQMLSEGRSREDICEELGDIPMDNVYTLIHRARQRLIKILKEDFGVDI